MSYTPRQSQVFKWMVEQGTPPEWAWLVARRVVNRIYRDDWPQTIIHLGFNEALTPEEKECPGFWDSLRDAFDDERRNRRVKK